LEGGEQELDAGDVVAAVEGSGTAWQLGKWPPRPGKRRGQVRWRWRWHWRAARGQVAAGQLAGVKAAAAAALGQSRAEQSSWRWTTRTWLQILKSLGTPL
jgi:hypothetical protein